MKSLNKYINESLLDDLEDLEKDSDNGLTKVIIENFLKENYYIKGNYTIKNSVVDVNGDVVVKNRKLTELTNGMFVFGEVSRDFYCCYCSQLTSLEGAPEEVGRFFYCDKCNSLINLKGAPKKVGYGFICDECKSLTSLEGAPEEVSNFNCSDCSKLKSLKGAPKNIYHDFSCSGCKSLTSLKGAPKKVGREFICTDCGTKFTKEQVAEVSNAKYIIT